MIQINCSDVAMFEQVQNLAREFGLTLDTLHGPKQPELEGLRVVRVSGLPERMELFQTVLPVKLHQSLTTRAVAVGQLEYLLGISP